MSDVRIFSMLGTPTADTAAKPSQAPGERLDKRMLSLEHVDGDGVWAKRRRLGEGNQLALTRGGGGSCSYVIQVRVPDPELQAAHVRRIEDESIEATQEVQSWAEDETEQEQDAQEIVTVGSRT